MTQYITLKELSACFGGMKLTRLRAKCKELKEVYGYDATTKDENGRRIFSQEDVEVIKAFLYKGKGFDFYCNDVLYRPKNITIAQLKVSEDRLLPGTAFSYGYHDKPGICPACGKKIVNVYGNDRCGC
ncbi:MULTISPECIES: hypothetical protein [Bacillus]|uniref:hypothetical protein n=1 Tax=Bacillus TaxID=1386 RepID=UPI0002F11DC7|nr:MULTISPECIES: hypothetical protein [Bacillus]